MFKLKPVVLLAFLLGSNMVFAGTMGPACAHDKISTSCNQSPWEFGAMALFLQPSFGGDGLGYATYSNYSGGDTFNTFTTINGAPDKMNFIAPKWAWGFQIEAAYDYKPGNDLNLNWYHLNEKVAGYLPVDSMYSGNLDGLYAGHMSTASTWDAVNLELGQHVHFNEKQSVRLHAGVAFVGIKNTIGTSPKLLPTDSSPFFTSSDTLTYNGFGPRLGADFGYDVGMNIRLYAKAAGSLFVGTAKQQATGFQNFTDSAFGLQLYGAGNSVQSNPNVIVPEFESKLGMKYTYTTKHGNLGFDLGYLWINYLQSVVKYSGIGVAESPGFDIGENPGITKSSNYTLNGLYFGLKWDGDFA